MKMIKKTLFLLLLLPFVIILTLNDSYTQEQTMRYAEPVLPQSLNPLTSRDRVSLGVIGLIYTGLVKYPISSGVVPVLVERYQTPVVGGMLTIESCGCVRRRVQNDGRTVYTFTLRDGIQWHDGTPVTSDDVKATYEYARRIDTRYNFLLGYLDEVRVNNREINFIIKGTDPPVELFMIPIVPRRLLGGDMNKPVGCGFYRFVKRDETNIHLQLVDNHPLKPQLSNPVRNIVFKQIGDVPTLFEFIKTGQIDFIPNISYTYTRAIEEIPSLKLHPYTTNNLMAIALNMGRLSDKRVREALLYAIDRNKIMMIYIPVAKVFDSPVTPGSPFYVPFPVRQADVARARRLLQESGFRGILRFKVPQERLTDHTFRAIVNEFVESWRRVGYKIDLIEQPLNRFQRDVFEDRNFELALVNYEFSRGYGIRGLYTTNSRENITGYHNEDVDRLFRETLSARSLDEIHLRYTEIQRHIYNDIPYIFIGELINYAAYNRRLDTKDLIQPDDIFGYIHLWEMRK